MVKVDESGTGLRRAALSLVCALSCIVTGCASVGAPERVSTLGPEMALQPQADGSKTWHSAHSQRYQAVHIDPAAIAFGPAVQLEPAQREELQQAIATALNERFAAAGWALQKSPGGPGSLTVAATVTEVQLAKTGANILTTLLLIGPLSHGGVTVELLARDGSTGQAIAAMAFSGKAGIEDISTAYTATGHARLQAQGLAQRFVQLLAQRDLSHGQAR